MPDLLPSFIALVNSEPPLLAWQPNPAHADWQTELSKRQAAYDIAQSNVTGAAKTQVDAQTAYDQEADAEPDPTIVNRYGKEIVNPEHTVWIKVMVRLKAELDNANTAFGQAKKAADDAQTLRDDWAKTEPPLQVVSDNPDYQEWKQHIATVRAALEATRWDTIYDGDDAQSLQELMAAQSQLDTAYATLTNRHTKLDQLPGQIASLTTQAASLAGDVDTAHQACERAQNDVNTLLQQQQALAVQQPETTLTQPNPDYAAWQAQMAPLQQALDAARAQAAGSQQAVAAAQQAVDDQINAEPDPTFENQYGKVVVNPAHTVWAKRLAALRAALDAAVAAAAPTQQALAAAQAAWDAGNATQPPPTLVVDNPAWQIWMEQTKQVAAALGTAQGLLADTQTQQASAEQILANTQANLLEAQAAMSSLPQEIAAVEVTLPALQQAVDQASAVQAMKAERIAVLLGQSASDAVVLEVFNDLFARWSASADAADDFDSSVQLADDKFWRLQARVDEFTRKIAEADTATKALQAPKSAYDAASIALDKLTLLRPKL